MSAFGIPASAIQVIPEGPPASFRPVEDAAVIRAVLQRFHLSEGMPLILYVGGISPHKNLQGLARALARVRQSSPLPWHLVLVGDYAGDSFYGCYQEVSGLCRQLGLAERVTFTGYVSNQDLVALYSTATLVVLPSFSEGFGLPVVEAMACGVPVAASRRGSLPEVLGPAGLLFDPENHAEMAAVITRLLTDQPLRAELGAAGRKRAEGYSWKTAARIVVGLFEEMCRATARTA